MSLAAPWSAKLSDGLRGRRGWRQRAAEVADRVRGGLWFHVTSVGEYEQARPVITALQALPERPPVIVTHFSPSGYEYARKRPCADHHDYLPFDTPSAMNTLLKLWQPRLLAFVKFDAWPNQVAAAAAHGVPVVLLAGSLQPKSGRLHPVVRPLFRDMFNRFSHVGVCTPDDQRRFLNDLQVSCPVSVTGDTRVEQVILRYEAAQDGPTAAALKAQGGRRLVLGSTWPPDEQLWLPVLPKLLRTFDDLQVVLTPHEPLPERLADLERRLSAEDIPHRRLSALTDTPAPAAPDHTTDRVILVDSIGVLAEIYRAGHLAYVGGSFTTGVHNTMEPAVASLPVMFGPVIQNAEEAGQLVARDAGFVVRRPDEALAKAGELLADADLLQETGRKARQVVLDQRGATAKSLAMLAEFLPELRRVLQQEQ